MSAIEYLMELYRAPYEAQDRIRNHLEQNPEIVIDLEVGRKVIPYYRPISDLQLTFWDFVDAKGLVLGEKLLLSVHDTWTWDNNFDAMWTAEAGRKRKIDIIGVAKPSVPYPHAPL